MSGARIRTNVGPLMANGVAVGTGDGLGSGDAARPGPDVAAAWFETGGEIGRSAPHAAVIIATTAAAMSISRSVSQDRPISHASPAERRDADTMRLFPRGSLLGKTSLITRSSIG